MLPPNLLRTAKARGLERYNASCRTPGEEPPLRRERFYAFLSFVVVACLLCRQSARAQPTSAPTKLILVLCDGLTIDDLENPHHPALYLLARSGAAGLMNVRT